MNEDLLGKCRACGQMVSKNLVTRGSFGSHGPYTGTVQGRIRDSGGCPHCGEAEPHLTEEEIEERKTAQQEAIEGVGEGCGLWVLGSLGLVGLCVVGAILMAIIEFSCF